MTISARNPFTCCRDTKRGRTRTAFQCHGRGTKKKTIRRESRGLIACHLASARTLGRVLAFAALFVVRRVTCYVVLVPFICFGRSVDAKNVSDKIIYSAGAAVKSLGESLENCFRRRVFARATTFLIARNLSLIICSTATRNWQL